ncbi:MAG: GSCFA domain-containing protein, partial [Desulfovibrio sp.]|nr:GSCFA domain-containing protein [Desulfovibrio sp.]
GTLYNPLSIANAIHSSFVHCTSYIVPHDGLWHSMMHHGSFSRPTREEAEEGDEAREARHEQEGAAGRLHGLDVDEGHGAGAGAEVVGAEEEAGSRPAGPPPFGPERGELFAVDLRQREVGLGQHAGFAPPLPAHVDDGLGGAVENQVRDRLEALGCPAWQGTAARPAGGIGAGQHDRAPVAQVHVQVAVDGCPENVGLQEEGRIAPAPEAGGRAGRHALLGREERNDGRQEAEAAGKAQEQQPAQRQDRQAEEDAGAVGACPAAPVEAGIGNDALGPGHGDGQALAGRKGARGLDAGIAKLAPAGPRFARLARVGLDRLHPALPGQGEGEGGVIDGEFPEAARDVVVDLVALGQEEHVACAFPDELVGVRSGRGEAVPGPQDRGLGEELLAHVDGHGPAVEGGGNHVEAVVAQLVPLLDAHGEEAEDAVPDAAAGDGNRDALRDRHDGVFADDGAHGVVQNALFAGVAPAGALRACAASVRACGGWQQDSADQEQKRRELAQAPQSFTHGLPPWRQAGFRIGCGRAGLVCLDEFRPQVLGVPAEALRSFPEGCVHLVLAAFVAFAKIDELDAAHGVLLAALVHDELHVAGADVVEAAQAVDHPYLAEAVAVEIRNAQGLGEELEREIEVALFDEIVDLPDLLVVGEAVGMDVLVAAGCTAAAGVLPFALLDEHDFAAAEPVGAAFAGDDGAPAGGLGEGRAGTGEGGRSLEEAGKEG